MSKETRWAVEVSVVRYPGAPPCICQQFVRATTEKAASHSALALTLHQEAEVQSLEVVKIGPDTGVVIW